MHLTHLLRSDDEYNKQRSGKQRKDDNVISNSPNHFS